MTSLNNNEYDCAEFNSVSIILANEFFTTNATWETHYPLISIIILNTFLA